MKILTLTKVKAYTDEGVLCEDAEGKEFTVPADTIIEGTVCVSNTALYDEVKGVVDAEHLHLIGNASPHEDFPGVAKNDPYGTPEYKRLLEAVRDGYITAMSL